MSVLSIVTDGINVVLREASPWHSAEGLADRT